MDILVSCLGSYAALIGFTGPLSAIGSILTRIDYIGLDHVMVFANGDYSQALEELSREQ